ncbi:TPA: hypothetical protein ACMD0P_004472 [Vibrio parahaemolyticus]|uniref:hypothetical protein n=1 Tax=Vibrio parahaemolyticus TaxID=670 RepID=UPI00123BEF9B|nr:hypothetical protein [Vibrio parahaemolyticus]QET59967.1 hypothetical protein FOB75_03015 [Vibrio parahaemolyticus]
MSEWVEWHLTGSGWEKGATKYDGEPMSRKEPPSNRFLTCCYSEKSHTGSIAVERSVDVSWTSGLPEIDDLKAKFGECPNRL